jgi:hypothetical protein
MLLNYMAMNIEANIDNYDTFLPPKQITLISKICPHPLWRKNAGWAVRGVLVPGFIIRNYADTCFILAP